MTGGINTSNCGGNLRGQTAPGRFRRYCAHRQSRKTCLYRNLDGEVLIKMRRSCGARTPRDAKGFPDYYGKLVIGPAGENGVSLRQPDLR